jgi:nitrate reductase cytochrome c-type subunit
VSGVYKPPRTYGDLLTRVHLWHQHQDAVSLQRNPLHRCRFCQVDDLDKPLAHYSTRHYICRECIVPRADQVLPSIIRREKFDRRMRQAGAP